MPSINGARTLSAEPEGEPTPRRVEFLGPNKNQHLEFLIHGAGQSGAEVLAGLGRKKLEASEFARGCLQDTGPNGYEKHIHSGSRHVVMMPGSIIQSDNWRTTHGIRCIAKERYSYAETVAGTISSLCEPEVIEILSRHNYDQAVGIHPSAKSTGDCPVLLSLRLCPWATFRAGLIAHLDDPGIEWKIDTVFVFEVRDSPKLRLVGQPLTLRTHAHA